MRAVKESRARLTKPGPRRPRAARARAAEGGDRSSILPEFGLLEGLRRFLDGRRLEAAMPPELRRRGADAGVFERLGGLTNQNYKLLVGKEALVLRLPGRGTGRFIDRSTERANQEAASRAGFTPASIFFDSRSGVKITPYLADATVLDPVSARMRDKALEVARLLARFHGSGLRFVNDFDVFRLARIYERVARGRFARFYEGYARARNRVFALQRPLAIEAPPRVACHNDLVPENILETAKGLTLIDWEYSGMNDPAWDLASFTLESGFRDEDEEPFLAAYFGAPVPERIKIRIDAYRLLQDFLWSLWSLLQETACRDAAKARSYRDYGRDRLARAETRLARVESRFGVQKPRREGRR